MPMAGNRYWSRIKSVADLNYFTHGNRRPILQLLNS